ncbi:hypothetical protein PCANC_13595 [Puccinia coronata f. sp. avenae]|uniref:Uncharacterized protein n=1 Tax=Puccinia coronata f. sp. avenae TaxID=200324 RepID=A0A2N5T4Z7_9BASI|nr:hypothetical protein PCANC_13595 [Puccinia coronata f. sp. avenae]
MIQSNSPSLVKSLKESSSTGNSNNNPDQDPQIGADDEGRRKSTPLIDYTMTYTKCKKRSLGAEDHFQ